MSKKILIGVLSVILLLSVAGISCAPAAPTEPQELKPIDIQLSSAYPLFRGTESITLLPVFSISNPNSFPIEISSMEYILYAGDKAIGASQPRNIYILPEMEQELKDAVVMTFNNFIGEGMIMGGLSQAEAVGGALLIWKSLGGVLPIAPLQTQWDAMPDDKPMFKAEGVAFITSEAGEMTVPFQSQWQGS